MECRVEAQQYYISVSFGDVIRIFGKRHIKSGTLEDSADHHRAVCIEVRGDDHNLHGCSHLDVVMIYTLLRGSVGEWRHSQPGSVHTALPWVSGIW